MVLCPGYWTPPQLVMGMALLLRTTTAVPNDDDARSESARLLVAEAWAEALDKNGWTPALLTGPAYDKFVDDEFASLRATMAKSGMI